MNNSLKNFYKRHIRRHFDGSNGITKHDVNTTFPLYSPSSAGSYKDKATLTIQAVNQIFTSLSSLSEQVNGCGLHIQNIEEFAQTPEDHEAVGELKILLDFYGSDKANLHNYHYLYGVILKNKKNIKDIFEIGLGSNNKDVVSNMGRNGKPGASHRAFRDYCETAEIYGADIDKRVLFQEDRIHTFFVNQTEPATFEDISTLLPRDFDLVIDDGLHSPNANINSLHFGLKIIRVGGWVVIEDIVAEAVPAWQVVAALLPKKFKSHIFKSKNAIVFAVERLK